MPAVKVAEAGVVGKMVRSEHDDTQGKARDLRTKSIADSGVSAVVRHSRTRGKARLVQPTGLAVKIRRKQNDRTVEAGSRRLVRRNPIAGIAIHLDGKVIAGRKVPLVRAEKRSSGKAVTKAMVAAVKRSSHHLL